MDPGHAWRHMNDEEVKAAAANLGEYTEVGRQAVLAELQRRGLVACEAEMSSRTTSRPHPRNKPWLPLVSGLVASVMLGALCVGLAGGGHGVYAPMIVCFPYSMLLATLNQSIAMPHIVFALVQFPLYGAIIGRSWSRPRARRLWWALASLHVGTAVIVMAVAMKERTFWP